MTRAERIDRWVALEQGGHICACGCNKAIVITRNHAGNGIPKFIHGHGGRKKPPRNGYLDAWGRQEWIKKNQGKHGCECGCGETVIVVEHHYQNGIPKYIHGHHARVAEYPSDVERFWMSVNKNGPNGCWDWVHPKSKKKRSGMFYGHVKSGVSCVKNSAHRMSYYLHFGEFDQDLGVLHKCDRPCCVNPSHLFLGTQKDNNEDACRKGRLKRKYTERQVLLVAKLRSAGVRNRDVSLRTGVGPSDICAIMNGYTWRFVTGIKRGGRSNG